MTLQSLTLIRIPILLGLRSDLIILNVVFRFSLFIPKVVFRRSLVIVQSTGFLILLLELNNKVSVMYYYFNP